LAQSGHCALSSNVRFWEQNDALEQYLNAYFAGAMPNERQWLRMNRHHLQNPGLVHLAASTALQAGFARNSEAFLQEVGNQLDRLYAPVQAQAAPPPMPPMPPPVPTIGPTIGPTIDADRSKTPEGEPESAHMDAHFVSAPVSRDSGHYAASGEYEPGSRVTLSKAEREHAEAAGVSVEEYARQKLKMMKLKKAKVIKDE
jgi:hypothetical protein